MPKIFTGRRLKRIKPGNLPTVLIIVIVVIIIMTTIIGYVSITLNQQFDNASELQAYDRSDAIIQAVSICGTQLLQSDLVDGVSDWNGFAETHKEDLISYIDRFIPSDLKQYISNMNIIYNEQVDVSINGTNDYTLPCIVINFVLTENQKTKNCNIAFFVGDLGDGITDEEILKGDCVKVWMS